MKKQKPFSQRRGHVVFIVLVPGPGYQKPEIAYASKWAASRYVNARAKKKPQDISGVAIVEVPLNKRIVVLPIADKLHTGTLFTNLQKCYRGIIPIETAHNIVENNREA